MIPVEIADRFNRVQNGLGIGQFSWAAVPRDCAKIMRIVRAFDSPCTVFDRLLRTSAKIWHSRLACEVGMSTHLWSLHIGSRHSAHRRDICPRGLQKIGLTLQSISHSLLLRSLQQRVFLLFAIKFELLLNVLSCNIAKYGQFLCLARIALEEPYRNVQK